MNTTATETLSLRERAKLAYQEAEAARAAARTARIASVCQELRNDLAWRLRLYFDIALNDIVIVNDEWGEPREAVARDSGLYFSVTSASSLFVEAECAACHQKGDCWAFSGGVPAANWELLGKSITEFDARGGLCLGCRNKAQQ